MKSSKDIDFAALLSAARKAMKQSHSPYSSFKVGAAVLTDKGVYVGANVENASFGLTVCAERVAIFNAIMSEGPGKLRIRAIAVVNNQNKPSSPCGACRQVIVEFTSDAMIAFPGEKSTEIVPINELLTHSFKLSS